MMPETRYARSGDISIAYQVVGDGPHDLVFVPGIVSHIEFFHELPGYTDFLRGLAAFARVIVFDKRGSGLSDRVVGAPGLEDRMDDIRAVMEAAGSERAAAGVKIAWLETQTGVNYLTLRRHYGKWMPRDAGSELRCFAALDPALFTSSSRAVVPGDTEDREQRRKSLVISGLERCEKGGFVTPPGVGVAQVPDRRSKSADTFANTVSWVDLPGDLQ